MSVHTPKSIVIVGGGTAGWMAANLIIHAWPTTQVTLVESADVGIIGVGEGATPYLKTFFARLGINEEEWMPACDATYKVGINFENWSGRQGFKDYFHPFFCALDKPTADMFFHNCQVKRHGGQSHTNPGDFFISGELARQKINPALSAKALSEGIQEIDYAYHFDSAKLGHFLKLKACQKGLTHIIDNVTDVISHLSGDIEKVVTENHGDLGAELFIDCTGFRARLIHQTLKRNYVSYADSLLNNAAVAIQTPNDSNLKLEVQTRSIALSNGWMWKIPLTSRQGNGYVYSDHHISPNDAEQELRQQLNIDENADVRVKHLSMRIGRLGEHWHKNCLAVGLSQGFIEPLEATALMLTQLTVDQFIQQFDNAAQPLDNKRNTFNKQLNTTFDGVRDYIAAHYQLSKRDDTQYWRDNQFNKATPAIFAELKQAWLSRQDFEQSLSKHAQGLVYLRPSWYCIFAGMGAFPENLKPVNNIAPVEQALNYAQKIAQSYFKN
ncbi:tryptophan halogenase family protein [Glaciecola sp. KUL10]|uniref:tryptophan halogenase family protein n=1 Tax=Glaciecola sp. (strain KUL10) TaxID=2161813 RepID=UPI000D784489|nr:tryptophan halogenase family protein [Glaciecola sp. KUL10]GBL04548.1 tryptophan halogenase [Glaciecola sp. KUL10]